MLFAGITTTWAQSIYTLPLQAKGDSVWFLPAGEYRGQFIIDQPMHLSCEAGAVFNAEGIGSALTINAPNVTVEGCQFTNWGRNLTNLDSAIFVHQNASDVIIKANKMQGVATGIWLDQSKNTSVLENIIEGSTELRSQDRGNGIHLFAVSGAKIINNKITKVRDGIYIDTSDNNLLQGNHMEDLRYGIHYMYSHNNRIIGNSTRHTRAGYALMQSNHLTVVGNRSEQDQNYGIMMNYITYSTIENNFVSGVQDGTSGDRKIRGADGKALFFYHSLSNSVKHNRFENSTIGVHLTAGSENNEITENAFINNKTQVKYVALHPQEWSVNGRGNYWSDYLGWDRNGDGIGDIPYEPNDNVDHLLWMYPQAKLLLNSPGIQVLRWVQRAFPILKYPGLQDSHPLMQVVNRSQ